MICRQLCAVVLLCLLMSGFGLVVFLELCWLAFFCWSDCWSLFLLVFGFGLFVSGCWFRLFVCVLF